MMHPKVWTECSNCGTDILVHQSRLDKAVTGKVYCDAACHRAYHRYTFNCEICGKEVNWKKSRAAQSAAKYCSKACVAVSQQKHWNRGEPLDWYYSQNGYKIATARGHPMATAGNVVLQHWHTFWEERDYADWVIEAKANGASIHHKNGKRDDNRPENLELRMSGDHPHGVSIDDAIEYLEQLGYIVTPPREM